MNTLPPLAQRALEVCACSFGTTREAILGPSRKLPEIAARYAAIHCLASVGWGSKKIGRALNRDHTTIRSMLKKAPHIGYEEKVAQTLRLFAEPRASDLPAYRAELKRCEAKARELRRVIEMLESKEQAA